MVAKSSDQMDKVIGKLQDMEPKNWYIVFAAIIVVILALDYFLVMRPQLGTLSKMNPEIKTLSDNLKKTKDDIGKITEYKTQVQDLKGKVDQLRLRVRTKQEVPFIIEKISRIAHKNDLKIDQIMPNTADESVLLDHLERTYFDLPILIEARSTYHDFGRFINALESDDTFFKVDEFTVAAMAGSRLNTVKMTLKTIVYEEKSEKQIAEAKAKEAKEKAPKGAPKGAPKDAKK